MKIAVNTRFLLAGKLEGFGKFTSEIFKRVVQNHPEHTFYFLFDRPFSDEFIFAGNVKPVVLYPPARHPLLMYIWYQHRVKAFLEKEKIDVFVSPDGQTCLRTKVPTVTVMHDLAFEHFPEQLPFADRLYLQYLSPEFARKSTQIVTVSEFTKQDISEKYDIDKNKISIVYNAAGTVFSPATDKEKTDFTNHINLGGEYFLYVGAIHPRKNLVRVLQAYEQFRTVTGINIKLVIVGRKAWKAGKLEEVYSAMHFKDDVNFSGRLTDQELRLAYASAKALVYVPLLEGFGIPVVEAQQCHCPVITSNVSSLPEVAGAGALQVDPFSVDKIAAAMARVVSEKGLREKLTDLGKENARRFSWNHSAVRMWEAIEKAASIKNAPVT